MLFNSVEFIFLFLPVTLIIYFIIGSRHHHRIAVSWLVSASLFFYGWWDPAYLSLLIFSMFFNYSMGVILSSKNKSKILLSMGVVVNLSFLAYFKYTNFFIDNINQVISGGYDVNHIILPLAISFFTFQQIAYLVDAYRNEAHEYNFLHYALFVTFFPQLIAGPIVHHKEMLPQFAKEETYSLNISNLNIGLIIFIMGLFKKVVLADGIADYSTPVFHAADVGQVITFFDAWGGALAYTLQLYFDFSGYADMAIGIARMFGIILPVNFNSPYKSKNIIEFWRKWHMTLSRFLKDYLYIPLGGNRKGSRNLNIFITMLLGGLWHGAAWNFIIWGAIHGFYLIINHAWRAFRRVILNHDLEEYSLVGMIISIMITFFSIIISWVFFRAETFMGAINILSGMAGLNGFIIPEKLAGIAPSLLSTLVSFQVGSGINSFWGFVWIFMLLIVVFFFSNTQEIALKYSPSLLTKHKEKRITPQIVFSFMPIIYGFLFFVTVKSMLSVSVSEFLYFNF